MSDERYRIIAELVTDFAFEFSLAPDGTLTLEWMGGPLVEEIDFDGEKPGVDSWLKLIHPDDLPLAQMGLQVVLGGKLRVREYRVFGKEGELHWLRVFNQPIWDDAEDRVVGMIGAAQDITEIKRVEIALRESEEKYRATLDAMGDAIHVIDEDMKIVLRNKTALDVIGELGLETDILGRRLFDVFSFLSERNRDEYHRVFDSGEVLVTEEFLDFQGEERYTETRKIPVFEGGEVAEVVTVVRNITKQKQSEMALRESEERLRLLLENTEDIIFMQDRDGVYLYYNGPARYGISAEDVVGGTPYDFFPPDVAGEMMARMETVFASGEPITTENQVVWKGQTLWFSDFIYPVRDAEGEVIAVGIMSRNISEQKDVEEALRKSEEKYRRLVENLQEGIWQLDEDHRTVFVNDSMAAMLGYSVDEIMGRSPIEFLDDSQREFVRQTLQSRRQGEKAQYDAEFRCKDGAPLYARVLAAPLTDEEGNYIGALAGIMDITQRRRMEVQLQEYADRLEQMVERKVRELEEERAKVIHAGRLAALGELATSVAHELRQPLTAMLLEAECLDIITDKAAQGVLDPAQLEMAALDRVGGNLIREIERCQRIIDHLRAFGHISRENIVEVDLNQPIEDSFILIDERLRQNGVKVDLQLASDLPPIAGNSNRLEQVFINLISNASHAMEEMSRRVMMGEVERDHYERHLSIKTFAEDKNVVATVRDNGCGIPPHAQERVFESFFTTKPVGEGTGLGLSISQSIVTEHGGRMSFESEENEGTTFTIRFPVLASHWGEEDG